MIKSFEYRLSEHYVDILLVSIPFFIMLSSYS